MNKQIKQPSVPLYREVKFSGLSFDWQQNCEQSSVDEMNTCTLELRVLGRRPAIFSEQTCFIRAQTTCRKECNANFLACFFLPPVSAIPCQTIICTQGYRKRSQKQVEGNGDVLLA